MLTVKQPQNKHKSTPSHHRDKFSPPEKDNSLPTLNMGSQKVHFNSSGKHSGKTIGISSNSTDAITAQHKENVTALNSEWEKIKADLNRSDDAEKLRGITEYVEKNPNPRMQNFQPFDVEEFWGQNQLRNLPS